MENKHDNKHDKDFDAGFTNWIASAMVADWYKKHGKPIPRKWKRRFDNGKAWLNRLSAEDKEATEGGDNGK